MAKNLYNIDVLLLDGTTHRTTTALLTDDDFALVKSLFAQMTAEKLGCTSASVTLASALPFDLTALKNWLDALVPVGNAATKSRLQNLHTGQKV